MKKLFLLFAGAGCFSLNTNAQFVRGYGDQPNEAARSIQLTTAKNYLVSGLHNPGFFGDNDAVLSLFDNNGNLALTPTSYGGSDHDAFKSACEVNIGGPATYVAVGETKSFGLGDHDVYMVGVDATLNCVFQRTFGGVNGDKAHRIIEVNDAYYGPCFAIVGESTSYSVIPNSNVYVMLVSRNGGLLTSAVIGTEYDDAGFWIEQSSDGGYIICGASTKPCGINPFPDPTSVGIYVVKIAPSTGPNLNMQWDLIYRINPSGFGSESAYVVKEDLLGNSFAVTGITSSAGAGGFDVFLMGIRTNGIPLGGPCVWGGSGDDIPSGLIIDNQKGNYTVSGYSNSFNTTGNTDAFLLQNICGGGIEKIYTDNERDDFSFALTNSDAGGYIMAGMSYAFTPGNTGMYLVETDNNMNTFTACETEIRGTLSGGNYCTAGGSQLFTVTGRTNVPCNHHQLDWKESACGSIKSMERTNPGNENAEIAFSIAPNPAADNITLTYDKSFKGGTVKLVDPQGRILKTFTLTGETTEQVNISDLPAGIYLVDLATTGGLHKTKRIVKATE